MLIARSILLGQALTSRKLANQQDANTAMIFVWIHFVGHSHTLGEGGKVASVSSEGGRTRPDTICFQEFFYNFR